MRVATDIGGTFTDLAYFTPGEGQVRTAKVATTPHRFEQGVLKSLERAGIGAPEIDFFVHGSTAVINALTERKGAHPGLITTEGFREVLEIQSANRPDLFNMRYREPVPFVPRRARLGVRERMSHQEGGGEGRNGVVRDFEILCEEALVTATLGRHRFPRWGLKGGADGSTNRIEVIDTDGSLIEARGKTARYSLRRGQAVRVIRAAGGGYGEPGERPAESVRADVLDEYITAEQARSYGMDRDGGSSEAGAGDR